MLAARAGLPVRAVAFGAEPANSVVNHGEVRLGIVNRRAEAELVLVQVVDRVDELASSPEAGPAGKLLEIAFFEHLLVSSRRDSAPGWAREAAVATRAP